jgi:adenylate cyclase
MRKWLGRWIGLARLVALLLVAFAIFLRVLDPFPVQILRNLTFDTFHQIKPREPQPFPVAILDVDDESIAAIGQWPWPRTRFADLVDAAMQDGAVTVAFDIVFSEPDRLSPAQIAADNPQLSQALVAALKSLPDNDAVLAEAFRRSRVVAGETSIRSGLSDTGEADVAKVPHAVIGPDPRPFLLSFPDLVTNLPPLEEAALGRGVFTVRPDPDGVYRRAPLVVEVGGQLRMALAPELLRVATGGQPFAVRSNEAGVDSVVVAGQSIRTAWDGTVRPYLTPSQPARFVSAADLLLGEMPPGRLAGHLVFVGTSAIGLEDYRATPLGIQMPGVEIHAQLLENILSDTLLLRPNVAIAWELVTMFSICLLIIILAPIMNAMILILSTLIFLTTLGWGSYIAFANYRLLVDPSFTILSGLATIMFMSATNYLREERRRRAIRAAFGQYVSKDLVNEITENSDKLRLGGETRDLTLLFSDVRGFTAIAEGYRDNPAGLTALMNRFLNLLSKAILDQGGTIDKFMGDAVMAFWNAPMDHEDHERAACVAALAMRQSVAELNETRRHEALEAGRPHLPIDIGIGINTGSCVVGNMGSDNRFDYTAMGDPVNLASRLEGQSRYYGTSIIVGSSTEAAARDNFAFLKLDLIRVKGKTHPENVFALIGDASVASNSGFGRVQKLNTEMHAAYRARNWDEAERILAELEPLALYYDPLLKSHFDGLRDRIAAFRVSPPPDGWRGEYDATSK